MNDREIFHAALELPDRAKRSAYLDQACAGDPARKAQIEGLLEMHGQVGGFLESPPDLLIATADEPPTKRPGTVIGPYKLLEQIGEGGFGVVFMAEQQQPIRRKVALKVVKPGMDTRQVVAASRPNGKPWLSWSIRTLPVSSMRAPLPPLTQGARLDRTS